MGKRSHSDGWSPGTGGLIGRLGVALVAGVLLGLWKLVEWLISLF